MSTDRETQGERHWDVIAVAVQNTADDDNRIDALSAIATLQAELAALRKHNEFLEAQWQELVTRLESGPRLFGGNR